MEGLLPVGSVVFLTGSERRVMIIGVLQIQEKEGEKILWDYSGVLYPEGYFGPDKTFLFNNEQIEKVYFVGFQDEEQFTFKTKVDEIRKEFRAGATIDELYEDKKE